MSSEKKNLLQKGSLVRGEELPESECRGGSPGAKKTGGQVRGPAGRRGAGVEHLHTLKGSCGGKLVV